MEKLEIKINKNLKLILIYIPIISKSHHPIHYHLRSSVAQARCLWAS